eukprot:963956-Amorphochlora_amoeboformis.AAC.1
MMSADVRIRLVHSVGVFGWYSVGVFGWCIRLVYSVGVFGCVRVTGSGLGLRLAALPIRTLTLHPQLKQL